MFGSHYKKEDSRYQDRWVILKQIFGSKLHAKNSSWKKETSCDAFFCFVRSRLTYRLISYKWTIYAKYDMLLMIQLHIFGNVTQVWRNVHGALISYIEERSRLRHRTCIIVWIKSINFLVRSLSGPQKATTMVVIISAKKGVFLLDCAKRYVGPLQERWLNRYKRQFVI